MQYDGIEALETADATIDVPRAREPASVRGSAMAFERMIKGGPTT